MDYAWIAEGAKGRTEYANILRRLEGKTAWMSGNWPFVGDFRPWNRLQNTNADIRLLTDYLLSCLKSSRPSRNRLEVATAS
jgi:hypothetical protein